MGRRRRRVHVFLFIYLLCFDKERERGGGGVVKIRLWVVKTSLSVSNTKRSLGLFTFWHKRSTAGKKRPGRRV